MKSTIPVNTLNFVRINSTAELYRKKQANQRYRRTDHTEDHTFQKEWQSYKSICSSYVFHNSDSSLRTEIPIDTVLLIRNMEMIKRIAITAIDT